MADSDSKSANPKVFLDIEIDEFGPAGRIVIELYKDDCVRTANNFMRLCTGENGTGVMGQPLHLKGSRFHRIIPGFVCQGGDIVNNDGTSGDSVYGKYFDDETFANKCGVHAAPGIVSMANTGPNTNNSQFFFCLEELPHLNNKHVVFGRVREGLEVVKVMELCGSVSGHTARDVIIADCGLVKDTGGQAADKKD